MNDNMLFDYNNCTFCNSKKLIKIQEKEPVNTFYVNAIISDLKINQKLIKKIRTYQCSNCKIKLNNPWFNESISRKIYSVIYGQHNKSWLNLLNFIKLKILPNHGDLYDILSKNIKIKKYGEYNSPFMGLNLHFFYKETKKSLNFYKSLHQNLIKYLSCRQVAGFSKKKILIAETKSRKYVQKINLAKKNIKSKNLIKKYLFVDNSSLGWGINDNYKSVNSKSYAQTLFDLEIQEFDNDKKYEFDLFGIFHSLDHTFEPKKILNFALNKSKFVIVHCHNQINGVTKQHQFSITEEFTAYLTSKKIYTLDITNKLNKKMNSPEIYFICSKSKKNIEILSQKINVK